MTLYVEKPATINGDMKRLQGKMLQWIDQITSVGTEWCGIQGATIIVSGFDPENGDEEKFVIRFENHSMIALRQRRATETAA